MIRSIPLTQLVQAVDSNLPSGTIILDPSGNSIVFYKYKGTLVERDTPDFTQSTMRSRIKHSVSRGSTLAIKISQEDDITPQLTRDFLPVEIFHREKITQDLLDTYSNDRSDYVMLDEHYRFVFIIVGDAVPQCLQRFVASGDLVPIAIT